MVSATDFEFPPEPADASPVSTAAATEKEAEMADEGTQPTPAQADNRSAAFGRLVHALLALPRASAADLPATARALAPQHGLGEPDAAAAAELAARARVIPEIAAAETADQVFRELPFAVPFADGVLATGKIDLAYRKAGEWTLIDFKTADLTDARRAIETHGAQMAVYREALTMITGKEPRAALCLIKSGQLVEVNA